MRRNTTKLSLIEHRFNTGFTSSLVHRGSRVEDSRHLIYWSREGLNSTSFSGWVWRALKLTVKRFKGLSYLCFKRLPRTEFLWLLHSPQQHLISFFLPSIPAQYASPISYFNGTSTNRREPITRSEWATSKPHLWNDVFTSKFILNKTFLRIGIG